MPDALHPLEGFSNPRIVAPGILAIRGPSADAPWADDLRRFCDAQAAGGELAGVPLIVIADDSEFVARSLENFLWITFTRSDPAGDIDGIGAFCKDKHWGCTGSLVIDARRKPHHAPPVEPDPDISRRIDALAARGGPLSRWL